MQKLKWGKADIAAQTVINRLLTAKNLSNRAIERLTHGDISYNRLRGVRVGVGSPLRVGEIIEIFRICDVNPVTGWKQILSVAGVDSSNNKLTAKPVSVKPLRQAEQLLNHANTLIKKSITDMGEQQSDYVLVANWDPNRDIEADTPDE